MRKHPVLYLIIILMITALACSIGPFGSDEEAEPEQAAQEEATTEPTNTTEPPTPTPEPTDTATPEPTPTPEVKSAEDLMAAVGDAMAGVESYHMMMDMQLSVAGEGVSMDIPVTFEGDVVAPDSSAGRLSISFFGMSIESEFVSVEGVNYMTNDKLLNIGLKKMSILGEDLDKIGASDIHELLRAWELKHRFLASESVFHHTLFRKETRWPGYYYRGDAMKVDDKNWHVLTVSRRDPETGEYTMEKAPLYHLVGDIEDKDLAKLKAEGHH